MEEMFMYHINSLFAHDMAPAGLKRTKKRMKTGAERHLPNGRIALVLCLSRRITILKLSLGL
jgi:hypothetical protein